VFLNLSAAAAVRFVAYLIMKWHQETILNFRRTITGIRRYELLMSDIIYIRSRGDNTRVLHIFRCLSQIPKPQSRCCTLLHSILKLNNSCRSTLSKFILSFLSIQKLITTITPHRLCYKLSKVHLSVSSQHLMAYA